MSDATRSKLLLQLAKNASIANDALPGTAAAREMFARLDMNDVAELYRVLEFALLLNFDLSILFADFVKNEHKPQAHVYARFVILTIYEGTKTYRHLLGKQLQKELASSEATKDLIPHIRASHKALNDVASEAEEVYADVRNGIAAHRDSDATTQLRRLRQIGGEELTDFVLRFLRAAGQLQILLSSLTASIARSLKNHIQVIYLHPGSETIINVTTSGAMPGQISPIDAQELDWHSPDPTVAEINPSGLLRAYSPGNTRITFRRNVPPKIDGSIFVFVGDDAELAEMSRTWKAVLTGEQ